jgi:hypothetical protein
VGGRQKGGGGPLHRANVSRLVFGAHALFAIHSSPGLAPCHLLARFGAVASRGSAVHRRSMQSGRARRCRSFHRSPEHRGRPCSPGTQVPDSVSSSPTLHGSTNYKDEWVLWQRTADLAWVSSRLS